MQMRVERERESGTASRSLNFKPQPRSVFFFFFLSVVIFLPFQLLGGETMRLLSPPPLCNPPSLLPCICWCKNEVFFQERFGSVVGVSGVLEGAGRGINDENGFKRKKGGCDIRDCKLTNRTSFAHPRFIFSFFYRRFHVRVTYFGKKKNQ